MPIQYVASEINSDYEQKSNEELNSLALSLFRGESVATWQYASEEERARHFPIQERFHWVLWKTLSLKGLVHLVGNLNENEHDYRNAPYILYSALSLTQAEADYVQTKMQEYQS